MSERFEWVEIIEPKSRERMYANLTTGECVWDPPSGVKIKKTDDNQWWELYDQNTSRFYYYNAATQKTVWHRPQHADIIPLAKLQTLKQNTEVRDGNDRTRPKTAITSETANELAEIRAALLQQHKQLVGGGSVGDPLLRQAMPARAGSMRTPATSRSAATIAAGSLSPLSQPKKHHHHHHHHHHGSKRQDTSSVTSAPVTRKDIAGGRHQNGSEDPQPRRGSQPLQTSMVAPSASSGGKGKLGVVGPQKSLAEPARAAHRLMEVQHSLDLHRGSLDSAPLSLSSVGQQPSVGNNNHNHGHNLYRQQQESYSRDDYLGFARELPSQQHADASLISSVLVTPRPKPRSFPRTNPAFVGVPKRESLSTSSSSYRKVGSDQFQPPTAVYSQRFYNASPTSSLAYSEPAVGGNYPSSTSLQSAGGRYTPSDSSGWSLRSGGSGGRHDRSEDSDDASHSSFGLGRLRQFDQMTDSQVTSCSSLMQEPSDDNSSQDSSSVRNSQSSQSSMRSTQEVRGELQPQPGQPRSRSSIGRASTEHFKVAGHSASLSNNALLSSQSTFSVAKPTDGEDMGYANLPQAKRPDGSSSNAGRRTFAIPEAPPLTRPYAQVAFDSLGSDGLKSGDSVYSSESLLGPSDAPSVKHDTPGSVRSQLSLNSLNINYSEGPDQGYDESDNSSMMSSPSPLRERVDMAIPAVATAPSADAQQQQLASLRRTRVAEKSETAVRQTMLEKSQSMQGDLALQQRPVSLVLAAPTDDNGVPHLNTNSLHRQASSAIRRGTLQQQRTATLTKTPAFSHETPLTIKRKIFLDNAIICYAQLYFNTHRRGLLGRKVSLDHMLTWSKNDIETFVTENLNEHRKGILGKTVPVANMLTWTKDVIQKPMIRTSDKVVKREAPEVFRIIQMYMGDKKPRASQLQLALEIASRGWSTPGLRDEIYIQLCRQTTDNKRTESNLAGWELLGTCLMFFAPSVKFFVYLDGYISKQLQPEQTDAEVRAIAERCRIRLERIFHQSGIKKGLRKPSLEEVEQARVSLFRPSMFGSTLQEIMLMQKERYPDNKLPWVQTTLSEEVLRLGGAQTEGIFRVPGNSDEVNAVKLALDQWHMPEFTDAHVPASLLKLWYRELHEPLIPPEFYEQCVDNYSDVDSVKNIVNNLPPINRLVLYYCIRFLQVFAATENAAVTKMDVNNLAMVMAPNCLRCESDDPRIIFENTRKEMGFLRTLILNLDTSSMEGVV